MPKIDISETFDIPYDSLSNEQRLAIKLLMEGNALKNPVEEKVKKTKVAVDEEKKNVEERQNKRMNIVMSKKRKERHEKRKDIVAREGAATLHDSTN